VVRTSSFASSKAVSRGRSSSGRPLLVTGNDDDDDDAALAVLVLLAACSFFSPGDVAKRPRFVSE
jgi:hypothetical protein